MIKRRDQIHCITTIQTSLILLRREWITPNDVLQVCHNLTKRMGYTMKYGNIVRKRVYLEGTCTRSIFYCNSNRIVIHNQKQRTIEFSLASDSQMVLYLTNNIIDSRGYRKSCI